METVEEYADRLYLEAEELIRKLQLDWFDTHSPLQMYAVLRDDDNKKRLDEIMILAQPEQLAEWIAARRKCMFDEILADLEAEPPVATDS